MQEDEKKPALRRRLTKRRLVHGELQAEIESGKHRAHQLFYSEAILSSRFRVSRQTIRQALSDLQEQRLLYRVQGKGTYVSPKAKRKQLFLVSSQSVFNTSSYFQLYFTLGLIRGLESPQSEFSPLFATAEQFRHEASELHLMYPNLAGVIYLEIAGLGESVRCLDRIEVPYLFYGSDSLLPRVPKHDISYYLYHESEIVHTALSYLNIEAGHERIGVIYTPKTETKRRRYQLWKSWMGDRGLAVSERWVIEYDDSTAIEQETQRLQRILAANRDVTALFCADDYMAVTAINAAVRAGLRVPEDIAIVGVNNYDFTQRAVVPVTTVEIPLFEDAQRCAELLTARGLETARAKSPVRLVRRQSA